MTFLTSLAREENLEFFKLYFCGSFKQLISHFPPSEFNLIHRPFSQSLRITVLVPFSSAINARFIEFARSAIGLADNCSQELDLIAATIDVLLILVKRFKVLSKRFLYVGFGENRDRRPVVNEGEERFFVECSFQHEGFFLHFAVYK